MCSSLSETLRRCSASLILPFAKVCQRHSLTTSAHKGAPLVVCNDAQIGFGLTTANTCATLLWNLDTKPPAETEGVALVGKLAVIELLCNHARSMVGQTADSVCSPNPHSSIASHHLGRWTSKSNCRHMLPLLPGTRMRQSNGPTLTLANGTFTCNYTEVLERLTAFFAAWP